MEVSLSFFSEDGSINHLTGIASSDSVITSAALTYPTLRKEKIFATFKFGNVFCRSNPTKIIPFHSEEVHSNFLDIFKDYESSQVNFELLSTFLILKFNDKVSKKLKCYASKQIYSEDSFQQGDDILIQFIPDGQKIFFYTLSHGIASVTFGNQSKIILTTANLCSGSSGAPIYRVHNNQRALSGMIIGSLGDMFGLDDDPSPGFTKLYLGVHISTFIGGIYNHKTFTRVMLKSPQDPVAFGHDYLVSIESGPRVGSGIILSSDGMIMTCSHVVNFESDVEVTIFFPNGKLCTGHVIFASDSTSNQDIAFIATNLDCGVIPCCFSSKPPLEGEAVYIVGYALFGNEPVKFLNKGILSSYKPYIIATSVTLHGCSGGAIINKDGQIIGMTTSIYDTHPNFMATRGLPFFILQPYLNAYIEKRNVNIIKAMLTSHQKIIMYSKI